MSVAAPLTIRNGRLVLSEGEPRPGAIRCENGTVVALGGTVVARDGDTVVDAKGALITPALVDLGVFAIDRPAFHFGGIVRAALMPDETPPLDHPARVPADEQAADRVPPRVPVHRRGRCRRGREAAAWPSARPTSTR